MGQTYPELAARCDCCDVIQDERGRCPTCTEDASPTCRGCHVRRTDPCPSCDGKGYTRREGDYEWCADCRMQGRVPQTIKCGVCRGHGRSPFRRFAGTCYECDGAGRVPTWANLLALRNGDASLFAYYEANPDRTATYPDDTLSDCLAIRGRADKRSRLLTYTTDLPWDEARDMTSKLVSPELDLINRIDRFLRVTGLRDPGNLGRDWQ